MNQHILSSMAKCFRKTIFSMTFFEIDQDGSRTIRLAANAWLYIAITVPLTFTVFVVWVVWLKWQFRTATNASTRSSRNHDGGLDNKVESV